ncbi:cupin domain-containing protein [Rhodococcus sp. IEGM1428]|uniref:cupin domain-containing protein n=1 Tax=Rhodococcus sp. IEGM1428 TaxID=3392191 RepID=UPI003D114E1B
MTDHWGMQRLLDTAVPLARTPIATELTVSGAPEAGFRALTAVAGTEVGVWEMTRGVARDIEVDEVFVVLSGAASVKFENGDTIELSPGVAVRLREGDKTTWTVHETLRKLYLT